MMINDKAILANDLDVIVRMVCPDVDQVKLSLRLEEVMTNYEIQKKSNEEVEQDMQEKVDLFVSSKKLEGLSELTLEGYVIELGLFSRFINKATSQVTTVDIRNYLASNQGVMMSTTGKKLSVLKSFFGWLVDEEMILRNPTSKIKLPKTPKRLPKSLTIEELEIVREACSTLRERALIEVMYSTACRLSEIATMKISDVSFQNMSAKVIGKGDKERTVFLSFKALYHLKKYLNSRKDDCEYLFVTVRKPYRKLGNRTIQDIVGKVESAANISKDLTPHVMRHTFATLAMENGVDLADLQQLMGHENPATSLVYTSVSEERKRQAHKRFHVM